MASAHANQSGEARKSDIRDPSTAEKPSVDSDTVLLASLLTEQSTIDLESLDETDVVELLRKLETADGLAQGVENRLDNIIGHLDHLLGSLEAENGKANPQVVGTTEVAPQNEPHNRGASAK